MSKRKPKAGDVYRQAAERTHSGEDIYSCCAIEGITDPFSRVSEYTPETQRYRDVFRAPGCGAFNLLPIFKVEEGETLESQKALRILMLLFMAHWADDNL